MENKDLPNDELHKVCRHLAKSMADTLGSLPSDPDIKTETVPCKTLQDREIDRDEFWNVVKRKWAV